LKAIQSKETGVYTFYLLFYIYNSLIPSKTYTIHSSRWRFFRRSG